MGANGNYTSDRRSPSGASWLSDDDWSSGTATDVDVVDGELVCRTDRFSTTLVESWGDLSNWSELGAGISLDATHSVSGTAAYMGHDRRNGPHPIKQDGERTKDGAIHNGTIAQSPREGIIETTSYISSHSTHNNSAGFRFRVQDAENGYVAGVSSNRSEFWVTVWTSGSASNIQTVNASVPNGRPFAHRVEMAENASGELAFTLFVDGQEEAMIVDPEPRFESGGAIGIGMSGDDGNVSNYNTAYTGWWTDDTTIMIPSP